MRTNIDIDEDLLRAAMQATGEKTKRAVVHRGLQELVKVAAQRDLFALRMSDESFDPALLEDIDKHRAW
jgi:Arc/MetJ family transcription regulator